MQDLNAVFEKQGLAGVSRYGNDIKDEKVHDECEKFLQTHLLDYPLWGLFTEEGFHFPECEIFTGNDPVPCLFTGKKLCRKKAYEYTSREGCPIPDVIQNPVVIQWLYSMGVKNVILDMETGGNGMPYFLTVPEGKPEPLDNKEFNLELLRRLEDHRCNLGRPVSFVVNRRDFKNEKVYVLENEDIDRQLAPTEAIYAFTTKVEGEYYRGSPVKIVSLADFHSDQHLILNPLSMKAHLKLTI